MLIYIGLDHAKIAAFAAVGADTGSSGNIAVKRSRPEKCVLFNYIMNCLTKNV